MSMVAFSEISQKNIHIIKYIKKKTYTQLRVKLLSSHSSLDFSRKQGYRAVGVKRDVMVKDFKLTE